MYLNSISQILSIIVEPMNFLSSSQEQSFISLRHKVGANHNGETNAGIPIEQNRSAGDPRASFHPR